MDADILLYLNDNIWIILVLLLVFFLLELVFSVGLYVIEDVNDSDLEETENSLNEGIIKKFNDFLDNKRVYENRFHAALITVNIVMSFPVIYLIYFFENRCLFGLLPVLQIFILIFIFIIFLLFNYLFFFSLPRRVIRHSAPLSKIKLALSSRNLSVIMYPIADLSDDLLKAFFNTIGKNKYNKEDEVTENDILSMVQESQDQGILDDNEAEMINNIFELNDKEAKDIMTNRNSIAALNGDTPLNDAIKIMLDGSNSRYPVYIDNLDHIIGILNLKDALRYQNDNKTRNGAIKRYPKLLREARFVLETRKIDDLFRKMQSDKLQMVIVIDEYGQTSGLVAMEDILEEIVGNILDEFDKEETFIAKKDEKTFEIDGLTPLEELNYKFNIDFEDFNVETLSGFLINLLGRIPSEDEKCSIEYKGYSFDVLQVDNHVIKTIVMKPIISDSNEDLPPVTDLSLQDVENKH